jgi:hypothetical protein
LQFQILFTEEADRQLSILEKNSAKKIPFKAVLKCLGYMETNLKHRSLQTHEFTSLKGADGEKVFESYAQNRTPGAYRIFWHYGPDKRDITIISITPHP